MTTTDEYRCRVCGNRDPRPPREWHHFQHPFTSADDDPVPLNVRGEDVEVRQMPYPFDPVLRQALVDKGLITPDDLRDAELKIRMITGRFLEAMNDDSGSEQRRGPDDQAGVPVLPGDQRNGGVAD